MEQRAHAVHVGDVGVAGSTDLVEADPDRDLCPAPCRGAPIRLHPAGPRPPPQPGEGSRRQTPTRPHPAPQTAQIFRQIFHEFLTGSGLYAIAEALTSNHVPCPSAHDRARNPHRSGIAWSKSAIRVILTNPRYTGRQVWNKQRTDEVLLDVNDVALGHTDVMRWNPRDKWVVSKEITHPPIIDEATFEQAQTLLARHRSGLDLPQRQRRARNPYVFRGLIHCAACNRRMQGQHNRGAAYYFPQEYPLANDVSHPSSQRLPPGGDPHRSTRHLARYRVHPDHIENTATAMADAHLATNQPPPSPPPARPSPTATRNFSATGRPSTPQPTPRSTISG
ncbi:recombinase family protein [Micromonospora sp. CA-249363]|uniref:recombinase family protein n=1 Tax=Micromonospora sp. CA-249363 TaxID=3239963 RepID=UPI003D8E0CE6